MSKKIEEEDLVVTRYPVTSPCPHHLATVNDAWCFCECENFIELDGDCVVCQHHRCPMCHGTGRVPYKSISGHDYEIDCKWCDGRGIV